MAVTGRRAHGDESYPWCGAEGARALGVRQTVRASGQAMRASRRRVVKGATCPENGF